MIAGEKPISDAELRSGESYLCSGLRVGVRNVVGLAGIVENLWISDLLIPQFKPTRMQLPARRSRMLRPRRRGLPAWTRLRCCSSGPRQDEEGVRSLNIGPIILLNADGSPVAPAGDH